MSERKERFTPGPWKTLHATHVLSSDNGYVARAYDSPLGPIANRHNATLIAASPDMYEFIKSLTSFGGQIALATLGEDGMKIYNEAMRVLAKARGEDEHGDD